MEWMNGGREREREAFRTYSNSLHPDHGRMVIDHDRQYMIYALQGWEGAMT